MKFDYIIVGNSLAAYSAAITLAEAKKKVGLLALLNENPIRAMFEINPTPINESKIAGDALDQIVEKRLVALGIVILDVWSTANNPIITNEQVSMTLTFNHHTVYSAKAIIYAPNGVCPHPPSFIEESNECMGRGLSYCAWSDAFFYKNKKVCVIGDGYWAFEQIQWCNKYHSSIILFGDKAEYGVDPYTEKRINEIIDSKIIKSTIKSIEYMNDSECRVTFYQNGIKRSIHVAGVFWAPERVLSWEFFGGENHAIYWKKLNKLHCAGYAAGVHLWDHNEQWESGERIAMNCLTKNKAL